MKIIPDYGERPLNMSRIEHAIGFDTRVRPLTYDELWEWCRRAPYYVAGSPRSGYRLIRRGLYGGRSTSSPVATDEDAGMFPLMIARAVEATLSVRS